VIKARLLVPHEDGTSKDVTGKAFIYPRNPMTRLIIAYENGPDNVSWFDVDDRLILMVLDESEHEQLSDGKKSIHEVGVMAEVALEDLLHRFGPGDGLGDGPGDGRPNGLDEKGSA